MTINNFLEKNKVSITSASKIICKDGIKLMAKSKDIGHNDNHVYHIIDSVDKFLNESDEVEFTRVDFNALLPMICWHDVWKSGRSQTSNIIKFKFEQHWDGIGSARIFKKYVAAKKIQNKLAKEIYFGVLHHGGIFENLHKTKSDNHIEARILADLDALNFWNIERWKPAEKKYLKNKKFKNPKLIPVARWIINKLAKKVTNFSFQWPQKEYLKKKKVMLRWGKEIIDANTKTH